MVESTGPGDGMSYFVDNDNCLLSYAVGRGIRFGVHQRKRGSRTTLHATP